MLETITIRTVWGRIAAALKSVPWTMWTIAALVALIPINGCVQYREGRQDGRESVLAELRTQQAKTAEKATKARSSAAQGAKERAETFEAEQRALGEAIEKAEAEEANALDGLF